MQYSHVVERALVILCHLTSGADQAGGEGEVRGAVCHVAEACLRV